MYEGHKEIIEGMCVTEREGQILMCDNVRHRSGQVDAVPKFVMEHPAGFVCESYAFPYTRKRVGGCALCTIPLVTTVEKKKPVNSSKASKRN